VEKISLGWFDGSSLDSFMKCEAGGVIKIDDFVSYHWNLKCGRSTNTCGELMGVWALLLMVSRLHIDHIQVFGDSKIIINWLENKCRIQVAGLNF